MKINAETAEKYLMIAKQIKDKSFKDKRVIIEYLFNTEFKKWIDDLETKSKIANHVFPLKSDLNKDLTRLRSLSFIDEQTYEDAIVILQNIINKCENLLSLPFTDAEFFNKVDNILYQATNDRKDILNNKGSYELLKKYVDEFNDEDSRTPMSRARIEAILHEIRGIDVNYFLNYLQVGEIPTPIREKYNVDLSLYENLDGLTYDIPEFVIPAKKIIF